MNTLLVILIILIVLVVIEGCFFLSDKFVGRRDKND